MGGQGPKQEMMSLIVYYILVIFLQGIFPMQGWNMRLLHWQVDSLLLSQQESPDVVLVVS